MAYLQTAVYICITVLLFFVFFKIFYMIGDLLEKMDRNFGKINSTTAATHQTQQSQQQSAFTKDTWKERQQMYDEADKKRREEYQKQQNQQKTKPQEFKTEIPACLTVLGFTKVPVNKEDIRTRYKKLSKIYHPDAGGTEEEFQRINEAWDTAKKLYNLS